MGSGPGAGLVGGVGFTGGTVPVSVQALSAMESSSATTIPDFFTCVFMSMLLRSLSVDVRYERGNGWQMLHAPTMGGLKNKEHSIAVCRAFR
ncbi:hypothetical protein GCM10008955_40850 [Deinococcus malanensis]|uniref:Uncharacterized protein n=1 Tax=Deinococcus malanensis TaxID=1706855 RepID=A0ABQ2F508_9DEIO|nr:hypothetical protein GCM10008955_40850 [Deinococcus malanensis]